ncbi:EAL domain-containing protein [Acidithiobacillus sp. HP-6]|uniref:EAL domain-containing protein n=1 Tax=unclassified Acidithiobacillus TaxID=2614800 RepID=UPI00187A61E9|nr:MULTISPECIES: EAL domain-containing protein [unclassified Acidithiobacillus]MBE7564074.1 EAL domain-containing protein [Acidithiobacillus sp. HP-6]MBE7571077.1 EAL domain-containing protein [Acidithiobacillus sp. HP-2]
MSGEKIVPIPSQPAQSSPGSFSMLQERNNHYQPVARPNILVLYQPIIDLKKGKVVRVEALVRFEADDQLISPDKVLPYLQPEEIIQINFAVLKQAAHDLSLWQKQGLNFKVSVNVEIFQLENPEFAQSVLRILDRENIAPQHIALEILEGSNLEISGQMIDQINMLRQKNMTFSLDDVGSAYSGLARIKNLPIDTLKLDGIFVRDLYRKPQDLNFIQALSALSRSLGKSLIVEGVEDATILNALRRLDVTLIQGYVFSRPITAQEIPQFICNLQIPSYQNILKPNDWIGAYAEILHERERLTAMIRHAPDMLDRQNIKKLPNKIIEPCVLMSPKTYHLYCQQMALISQAAAYPDNLFNDDTIERIEQGYRILLMEIEKQIYEANHDQLRIK